MYEGIFICVYICRLFPLPEDFLRVDQTVDHYVPVDRDSVIHKLRLELVYNYEWCIVDELNSSQPHHFKRFSHPKQLMCKHIL